MGLAAILAPSRSTSENFGSFLILSSTDSTLASRDAVMWNDRIARYEDERTLLAPVTALFENNISVWIFTT